jgi:Rrf2 family protein
MQLTQFSDYSLRLVLYLAAHEDELVTLQEVSQAYGISQHHLVKVAARLIEQGIVASVRGRNGGLRLNRAPAAINIGALVRATEPHFTLVECFDAETQYLPDRFCLRTEVGDCARRRTRFSACSIGTPSPIFSTRAGTHSLVASPHDGMSCAALRSVECRACNVCGFTR